MDNWIRSLISGVVVMVVLMLVIALGTSKANASTWNVQGGYCTTEQPTVPYFGPGGFSPPYPDPACTYFVPGSSNAQALPPPVYFLVAIDFEAQVQTVTAIEGFLDGVACLNKANQLRIGNLYKHPTLQYGCMLLTPVPN
jgi:hypothetical protein